MHAPRAASKAAIPGGSDKLHVACFSCFTAGAEAGPFLCVTNGLILVTQSSPQELDAGLNALIVVQMPKATVVLKEHLQCLYSFVEPALPFVRIP